MSDNIKIKNYIEKKKNKKVIEFDEQTEKELKMECEMTDNKIIKNHIEQKNNIKVIWFDEKIKNVENQNNFKQLKSFFNNIEQYEELDKGFENFYLQNNENKNEFKIILVIVSGRLFGRYIKKLQDNINKIINIPYTFIFTSYNFKKILLSQIPDKEHILSYDTMIMVNDGFYNPGGVYDNFED